MKEREADDEAVDAAGSSWGKTNKGRSQEGSSLGGATGDAELTDGSHLRVCCVGRQLRPWQPSLLDCRRNPYRTEYLLLADRPP